MTKQEVIQYAKDHNLLTDDPEKNRKILNRLYWHFNLVAV